MLRTIVAISAFVALALASRAVSPHERDPARRIEIAVTKRGFIPPRIPVRQGEEVTLVFVRKTDATCVRKVALELDRRQRGLVAELDLPLNRPTTFTLKFDILGSHAVTALDCKVTASIEVR